MHKLGISLVILAATVSVSQKEAEVRQPTGRKARALRFAHRFMCNTSAGQTCTSMEAAARASRWVLSWS